ncbi:hypothetical protein BBF96_10645 [Anoxybacter fermentans]|uniref:Glycosyltransferase 2-like domain-containing protein n=1 Tax=Anoxybacter fermentans TaxID=1323375 RepID=A0A3Q9HRC2_9FIRM|nr:glycosyltransferase [Anoxybacter fermentans]AZR73803.1 hypothetical protein BBF96_10645 [Anoxybacter fermentans]
MKKVTIVVPTYWTWPTNVNGRKVESIFDHPTPLDMDGTLARTLESFKKLSYPNFDVVVISAATNKQIRAEVEKKVKEIIDRFKNDFDIIQFSYTQLDRLKERLWDLGYDKILDEINLENYNNIRNLQLIVSHLKESDVVVGIDDDEIITDKDYLKKAIEYVGTEYKGVKVAGVAGYYLDEKGNHRLNLDDHSYSDNLFDKKHYLMDLTFEMLDKCEDRLVRSPVVFGGNMVIPRSTFEEVSFDPYNTRGEDIDYLINARMEGMYFFLDKELNVVHLPPSYDTAHNGFNLSKLKQDILRFVYEKEKLEQVKKHDDLNNIDIEELMPYPGSFFDNKLYKDAEEKLMKMLVKKDARREAVEFVKMAKRRAVELVPKYFEFRLLWKDMMKNIKDDCKLKNYLQ